MRNVGSASVGDNEVDGNGPAKLGGRMMDNMTPREARVDVPPTDPPHEFMAVIEDLQARLTKLEARDTRGLLGRLFGKGTVAALLLAVFLISGTAWAYTGFGFGTKACENWVAAKEEHYAVARRARFHGWTSGYLTAYSLWVEGGSGPVSRSDSSKGAWAWIDNYCTENPNTSVATAAEMLIDALKAK